VIEYAMRGGRLPQKIILMHAGDCIEGYTSQGGRLIKMQDLYLTEQVETYQRILEFQALELAALCEQLEIVVVPGNHDETTRAYEVSTTDSWALFAARNAGRFLELAGYAGIRWHFPTPGKLAVEFEAAPGLHMTMLHGHKVAGSAGQIMTWWKGASFGRQPGHLSNILITGHFHHFRAETGGDGRTWLQVPSMDGGSAWFANRKGDETPPGMITFWLEAGKAYPIQNLIVHSEG
jgi:predicted phosphodiesterase